MNTLMKSALAGVGLALCAGAAQAQNSQIGVLSCDVSGGIGLILVQKQTMRCQFRQNNGTVEFYNGQIAEYGVALGGVQAGHLVWGVLAATQGLPAGALAGTYAGVGAQATAGVGVGANLLVGGTGRAFSLQPLSIEGQVGVNIAGGVTTVTLTPAR
ncbi:MAG: DUF992 domain-containing protein [Beijerinckiaceae bacterium]